MYLTVFFKDDYIKTFVMVEVKIVFFCFFCVGLWSGADPLQKINLQNVSVCSNHIKTFGIDHLIEVKRIFNKKDINEACISNTVWLNEVKWNLFYKTTSAWLPKKISDLSSTIKLYIERKVDHYERQLYNLNTFWSGSLHYPF